MTIHYHLILQDKDSGAREERAFEDPFQGRIPSVAAWRRSTEEAYAWGRAHGHRRVVHEIVDAGTGLSFGRHCVQIEAAQ